MVTTQWLPFYALYLLKTLREPKLKNAVLAGLFFAMAALAEMIFASFLALFTAIVVLAVWRQWRLRWNALGRLALAMAVAALIWVPVLVPIAREFLTGDYALTGWGESVKLSADAVGLVTPTDLNPIATAIASPGVTPSEHWTAALRAVEEGKGRFSDINTVFLGYATLALALLGAWTGRKRLKPWIWSSDWCSACWRWVRSFRSAAATGSAWTTCSLRASRFRCRSPCCISSRSSTATAHPTATPRS